MVAALLAASAFSGCAKDEPYQKPLTPVRVRTVQANTPDSAVRYSASIEPRTRVDLAFKAGGYIDRLAMVGGRAIQDGDRVSRNMLLAQVRPVDYDQKIDQARARVAEAQAADVQARAALDRAQRLFQSRSLTRPELEQAQAAADAAAARVTGAQALVTEAETARADTALRAPLDGIVLKRLVEAGSLVGPGTPGFVLADTSSVKVVFGAPDTMLSKLALGATESISTEAVPNRVFTGRITKIAPSADPRSRVFDIEVTVPNADGLLKAGMVGVIQVAAQSSAPVEMIAVPLSAVVRAAGTSGYAVFLIEGKGDGTVARLRGVGLGPMLGNEVTVTTGLSAGERVITNGATIVTDGERVSVIP